MEVEQALVDVIPSHRQVSRAPQPEDRLSAQVLELCRIICPGKVGVLGPCRFRVVVGQQRRVLVATPAEALEPGSEGRVEPRPPRLRDARVRDLSRHGMLDRVLALALDGRAVPAAHEVALLEHPEVGLESLEQPVHRPTPEDTPDQ